MAKPDDPKTTVYFINRDGTEAGRIVNLAPAPACEPTARELIQKGVLHETYTVFGSEVCNEDCRGCSAESLASRVEKVLALPYAESAAIDDPWAYNQALETVRRILNGEEP